MIEQLLKKHLGNHFREVTVKRLTGGYTNEAFLLESDVRPLVAKVSSNDNEDMINEINCLILLEKTSITPMFIDSFVTDLYRITVTEYCEGENAQSILDQRDLEQTKNIYKLLGEKLANDIHSRKYNGQSEGIRECSMSNIQLEVDFVPKEFKYLSEKWLSKVKDDCRENWVLTHGDYGIHNVLYSPSKGLTVLDWEWSEWANPLTDVVWICWFTRLHYPEHAGTLIKLFMEEYLKNNPIRIHQNQLKGYCVYKVWKILNKIEDAPVQVQKEWVNRLKWTLEEEWNLL